MGGEGPGGIGGLVGGGLGESEFSSPLNPKKRNNKKKLFFFGGGGG